MSYRVQIKSCLLQEALPDFYLLTLGEFTSSHLLYYIRVYTSLYTSVYRGTEISLFFLSMLYILSSLPTLVTVSHPGLVTGLDKIMHKQKPPHQRAHLRAE